MALHKNKQKSWYIVLGMILGVTLCVVASAMYIYADLAIPPNITRAIAAEPAISSSVSSLIVSESSASTLSSIGLTQVSSAVTEPVLVAQIQPIALANKQPPVDVPTSPAPVTTKTAVVVAKKTIQLSQCDTALHTGLLVAINKFRIQNNKPSISIDKILTSVACNYSTWMSETGDFTHYGYGSTPPERCIDFDTSCDSENLAMVQNFDPQHIVDLWVASAGHREVLLGDNTVVGFGIAGNYVTADFR